MDQQLAELAAVVSDDQLSMTTKLEYLTRAKAHIKKHQIPEHAVATYFEACRSALKESETRDIGFSILSSLSRRLVLQRQEDLLVPECSQTLAILLRCLSDSVLRTRQRAVQALIDIWTSLAAYPTSAEVEEIVKSGISTNQPGGLSKQASLAWIERMQQEHSDKFKPRPFIPLMVACLQDSNSDIRDYAEGAIGSTFKAGDRPTKANLKREIKNLELSAEVTKRIFSEVGIVDTDTKEARRRSSSIPRRPISRPQSSHQSHPSLTQSQNSNGPNSPHRPRSAPRPHSAIGERPMHSKGPKLASHKGENIPPEHSVKHTKADLDGTHRRPLKASGSVPALKMEDAYLPPDPGLKAELDPSKPINVERNGTVFINRYLAADRQDITIKLADKSSLMVVDFEGKETEANWGPRELNTIFMRKLAKGNAPIDHYTTFMAMVKANLNGILGQVNSLRTSVSTHGCFLLQDITRVVGSGLDPHVEVIMQPLIKLSGGTKAIAADNAHTTVATILSNVTFKHSLLQHVANAGNDKNKGPRNFAQQWLKVLITRYHDHPHTLDHGNGLTMMVGILKKGLGDSDPGVRNVARSTFWSFYSVWHVKAESIMADLPPQHQKELKKHPDNPNPGEAEPSRAPSRGAGTLSRADNNASKASLKDVMAAKRKEKERKEKEKEKEKEQHTAKGDGSLKPLPVNAVAKPPSKPSTKATPAPSSARPTKPTAQSKPPLISSGSMSSAPLRPNRPKGTGKTPMPSKVASTFGGSRPGSSHEEVLPDRSHVAHIETAMEMSHLEDTFASEAVQSTRNDAQDVGTHLAEKDSNVSKPVPVVSEEHRESDEENAGVHHAQPNGAVQLVGKDHSANATPRSEKAQSYASHDTPENTPQANRMKWDAEIVIESGISRLNANTLDAHGFRKLNSTITSSLSEIDSPRLANLMASLIGRLGDKVAPNDDRIVMQENLLLRILFQGKKAFFNQYISDVLCNIVRAMNRYEEQSRPVEILSTSMLDFIQQADLPAAEVLSKLIALAESGELKETGTSSCLLAMAAIVETHKFDSEQKTSIYQAVVKEASTAMGSRDVSTRRHASQVATAIIKGIETESPLYKEVWEQFDEGKRQMILYNMRREGAGVR